MAKHTPGPWAWEKEQTCEPSYGCLVNADSKKVIDLTCSECGGVKVENCADRAMLAASPDLLEALEAMMFSFSDDSQDYMDDDPRTLARAAIAKATEQT